MTDKILFVDDDVHLLEGLQRTLRRQFKVETAVGGVEGLSRLAANGPFALVVADMQMPGMSGLEFLRQVQTQAPATIRLMLTGNADQKTAVDAVNDGRVFRFLNKPCPATALAPALEAGLEQFRRQSLEKELLENTLGGTLKVLSEILSMIDPATFERGQRLRESYREFARAAGLAVAWETEIAAMFLSIGRTTVPTSVLEKVRQRLLEHIPRLENVVAIVRYQQKNFDGSGFPEGVPAGANLPVGARLLKFLSDLDDLEVQGMSKQQAWQKMHGSVGRYDPDILLSASAWCQAGPSDQAVSSEPQEVKIEELRPGQILAKDVFSADGLFLLAADTRLTTMLVAKLLNFRRLQIIDRSLLVRE